MSDATTLIIDTLVYVRSLGSGEVLVAPLADGSLASVADEDEALLDQRLALAEHLGVSDPETLARFSFPKGTELRVAEVVVPREDLPRTLAIKTPISIGTAVVPSTPLTITRPRENEARVRAERWLVIIPLAYTSYLAFDERLDVTGMTDEAIEQLAREKLVAATDQRIADEVRRLWLAKGEGPSGWLSLLPGRKVQLAPVAVELVRGDAGPAARAATLKKRLLEREKRERAVQILDSVAQAVHLAQRRRAPMPLVGRDKELDLLRKLLAPNQEGERQSVVLVGGDRVGKSALLHGYVDAEHLAHREPIVYATSGAALIAGMSGLGQWQERVRRVMQAASDLGAILWFDDLGDLFSERGRSSVDVPSALRPWIEQGKVSIVGEVHEDRIDKLERQNVGFFAATARLHVPPLDVPTTLEALRARVAWDDKHAHDAPRLDDAALAPLVDLADRYLAYESFPGKAIRLYEELRAMHGTGGSDKKRIGVDEMFEATSLRTGVPAFLLREDRALHLDEVVAQLRSRVVGQDEAVRRVAETVCVVKAGLQPRGKPLATFLFVGPTGVGKTELARALAELLFRDPQRMTRFDMSEYMDALAADRLIRGHQTGGGEGRGEGVLTRKVREQPFCVLLLDEIEKAHPMVFDLLLQVCGEGRLTDAAGRTAYFHNAIIILTSNLGAADRRAAVGFERGASADHYERAIHSAFRPEFINRIDRIVAFRDLGPEHKKTLVAMALEKVRRRRGLLEPGCGLTVSDAAIEALGEAGYSPTLGARALRRHVENTVVSAVSELLAGWGEASDVDVDVRTLAEPELAGTTLEHAGLRVSLVKRGTTKATHEATAMRDIAEVRRELTRWLRLDRVVEVREQVKFLVAQLGYGKKDQRRYGRELSDHGKLQAEYHRLHTLLSALDAPADTVRAIEDLALDAYFRGEPITSLRKDARENRASFISPFVSTLIAQEPRRDEVTLILQELDDGRALGHYLPGLVAWAEQNELTLELHLDRGDRDDVPTWPVTRRWGPPRELPYLEERLAPSDRGATSVLVRARGRDAVLLALEGGLHRLIGLRDGHVHLWVTRIALRTRFTDAQWQVLDPEPPTSFSERVRLPVNRLQDHDSGRTWVTTKKNLEIHPKHYWPSFRELAMHHLLLCEEGKLDRNESFRGRLPSDDDEIRILLQTEGKISAIKRYRELTGVGLKEAKDAVEAMEDAR